MNGRNMKLGRLFGLTLAVGAFGMGGCEGAGGDSDGGGLLGNIAEQCGLSCPDPGEGVLYGNASVTGYGAIDSFFGAVVSYDRTVAGVTAEINAELDGIQSLFGLSDVDVGTQPLGAAIAAKLQSEYMASVVVKSQPAQCSVDAKLTAQATAQCQASANCQVDPGMVSVQCMGTCSVDVEAGASCDANAQLNCAVTAPSFACSGKCSGTCTLQTPQVNCEGTCNGMCMGTCSAAGDANGDGVVAEGECVGSCTGTCQAGCQVTGMAALTCNGTCNGTCEYTPATGGCDARAEVTCETMASASAQCEGRCEGEVIPPSAMCDASASCEASAKAEARFQVQCTPPSVEVSVVTTGNAMVQAEVNFLIEQLRMRLPRLAAATARAKIAGEAGAELGGEGIAAVQSTFKGVADGDVDYIVGLKIVQCVPEQLTASQTVIANASTSLNASLTSASSVAQTFGMVM